MIDSIEREYDAKPLALVELTKGTYSLMKTHKKIFYYSHYTKVH